MIRLKERRKECTTSGSPQVINNFLRIAAGYNEKHLQHQLFRSKYLVDALLDRDKICDRLQHHVRKALKL